MTMINPATLVYFAALTAGLGSATHSPTSTTAFILGVAVGSLAWQLLLVAAGSALGSRVGRRTQRATLLVGNTAVAAFAVLIVAGAVLGTGSG